VILPAVEAQPKQSQEVRLTIVPLSVADWIWQQRATEQEPLQVATEAAADTEPTAAATTAHCRVFTARLPFHQPHQDEDLPSCLKVWARQYAFVTEQVFPHEAQRSRLAAWHCETLSPLHVAISTVKSANANIEQALRDVVRNAGASTPEHLIDATEKRTTSPAALESLSRVLQGAIDAPISHGVRSYKPLLDGSFKSLAPAILEYHHGDLQDQLTNLQVAVKAHIDLLSKALRVHGRVCPESMAPMQAFLEERMETLVV
jgi:hypothetical protein